MLTVRDIAQDIGVTERTVRNWIRRGSLRAFKIQGVLRIKEADYKEFIDKARGRAGESRRD